MKKIRVLIITLVIILTLGCATFAVLYATTDIFKSDKEMFYKYAAQINIESSVNPNTNTNYIERLENETYSDKGRFSIKAKVGGEDFINEAFNYNFKSDPLKKFASGEIKVEQDNVEKLTIEYLRNEDLYGIKLVDVVKQALVLENKNLKEFAKKLEIPDTDQIPDKIEINNIGAEEIENINKNLKEFYSKYIDIIINEIPNESYSKVKGEDITVGEKKINASGYQVTIESDELKNILTKILNKAKNDEQIYKLLDTEKISFEEYTEAIEMLNDNLDDMIEKNCNLNIVVYKQGKETVKLYVYFKMDAEENSIDFSIDKIQNSYDFFMNINYEDDKVSISKNTNLENQNIFKINMKPSQDNEEIPTINITISTDGNLNSQVINSSAKIDIESKSEEANINIEYNNTKKFGENVEVTKYQQGDYVTINDLDSERISKIVEIVIDELYKKIDKNKAIFGSLLVLNEGLFENAKEAAERTQEAAERERALSEQVVGETRSAVERESELDNNPIEINGVMYNNMEEYLDNNMSNIN